MAQFLTRLQNHEGQRVDFEFVFKDDGRPSEDFVYLQQHRDGNEGPQLEILKIPRKFFRTMIDEMNKAADILGL